MFIIYGKGRLFIPKNSGGCQSGIEKYDYEQEAQVSSKAKSTKSTKRIQTTKSTISKRKNFSQSGMHKKAKSKDFPKSEK